ncbi:MBL fold metallo-hydrolase [Glaciibacter flavus]|uniref:MBL fold metallo-hydrolase n=1 Tax=Orlajensenia flava TaxID=2565934 RepID=UPI003AFF96C3
MCEADSTHSDTGSSHAPGSAAEPDHDRSQRSHFTRRSLLGAAAVGAGLVIAKSLPGSSNGALALGAPLTLVLPTLSTQPKGTVLTLLGTAGGPQAEYGRTGTSSVLTVDGYNYLVDAGRASVTQYLNSGLQFFQLAAMFMTHLHADHLADYYNYFLLEGGQANAEGDRLNLDRKTQLQVFGPGSAGALPVTKNSFPTIAPQAPVPGIKDLTERLNEGYAYSYNLFMRGDGTQDIRLVQKINEIEIPASAGASSTNTAPLMDPFKIYEDSRVSVSAILVPHGAVFPTFAYRFDTAHGAVVFSGDTSAPGFTPATNNIVKIAQGADILVHEVINWEVISAAATLRHEDTSSAFFQHLKTSHTSTSEVAKVAQAAGVPQLVLTHLIPSNPLLISDAVWKAQCSVGYSGRVHVGNDRDQIPLPAQRWPRT